MEAGGQGSKAMPGGSARHRYIYSVAQVRSIGG